MTAYYERPEVTHGPSKSNPVNPGMDSLRVSCALCNTYRPLTGLEPVRKGSQLKRCKDREACKTARAR